MNSRRGGFSIGSALVVASIAAFVFAAVIARADVTPANTSIAFYHADPSEVVTNGPFYESSTLLLTNCTLYASVGTSTVQNLDSCSITVKVGSTTAAWLTTTGNIQSAASGTWWTSFSVPTNGDNSCILQVSVHHTNGTSYIYNWKVLPVRSAL